VKTIARRAFFGRWEGVALLGLALSLQLGCPKKAGGSDLVGTWKDTSVNKLSRLTPQMREKWRTILTLKADGSGTLVTSGVQAPLHWTEKSGQVEIVDESAKRGPKTIPLNLSPDRRKMAFGPMEFEKQ
jgi:hypothetical protein